MTDQPSTRHQIRDIAILACGALGTGTGTGCIVGTPLYTMNLIEDRTYTRQHSPHLSENIDAIGVGLLGMALGAYIVHKSAQWLYKHI